MRLVLSCLLCFSSIVGAIPAAAESLIWKNPVMAFHDGDSGTILDVATGTVEKFRIDGYDSPEIGKGHAKCARERRHGVVAAARANTFSLGGPIEVEWSDEDEDGEIDRGRHKRGLLTVWRIEPSGERGQSLYDFMVGPKLALPYEGGTRPDWCWFLDHLLKERLKATQPVSE